MSDVIEAKLLGRVGADTNISSDGYFRFEDKDYSIRIPATWGMLWRDDGEDDLVEVELPDGRRIIGRVSYK